MKRFTLRRILPASLAAILAIALAGCQSTSKDASQPSGNSGTGQSESGAAGADSPQFDKVVELSMFGEGGFAQNVDKAVWYADWLAANLGVKLNFRMNAGADTTQLFQSLMASEELPDIVMTNNASLLTTAAEAGLLLNLDENQDALPDLYSAPELEKAINFYRDNFMAGKGSLYFMPG